MNAMNYFKIGRDYNLLNLIIIEHMHSSSAFSLFGVKFSFSKFSGLVLLFSILVLNI